MDPTADDEQLMKQALEQLAKELRNDTKYLNEIHEPPYEADILEKIADIANRLTKLEARLQVLQHEDLYPPLMREIKVLRPIVDHHLESWEPVGGKGIVLPFIFPRQEAIDEIIDILGEEEKEMELEALIQFFSQGA